MQYSQLKWKWLASAIEKSGMDNPDVLIEDLRRESPEDTDGVKPSFSVVFDDDSNMVVIRRHY